MEREKNQMTEKILNLTLDIIYLLTGENYIAFKLSNGLLASNLRKAQSPFLESSSHSPNKNNKKVQEVTSEMIELLTGEVPVRCQEVTVNFSKAEWEYLEGRKDLYNTVIRGEQAASPDKPRNVNPSLYTRDSSQDHHSILKDYQGEDLIVIKAEAIEEEEFYVGVNNQHKEEEIPTEIGAGGCYAVTNPKKLPLIMTDDEVEIADDFTTETPARNSVSPNFHPVFQSVDLSSNPSPHGVYFSDCSRTVALDEARRRPKNFQCSECGKCFTQKAHVLRHAKIHLEEKAHACSVCGRCYAHKSQLASHLRSHTSGKWFSCPECGICFGHKISLVRHQRIHTKEETFSCSDCGRCFTQKSHLVDHRRTHTGEKPYSCSQCGKRFAVKRGLVSHEKIHSGQTSLSCSECGKCFTRKSCLNTHQRVHQCQ
ncbi:gastrula zinc finger protein XlCGF66.1-like [Gastrophryne carolinensis]